MSSFARNPEDSQTFAGASRIEALTGLRWFAALAVGLDELFADASVLPTYLLSLCAAEGGQLEPRVQARALARRVLEPTAVRQTWFGASRARPLERLI
jgi:hypothetical protein